MAAVSQIVFRQWVSDPTHTNWSVFDTKMYQFGGPNIKKTVSKIILTATGASGLIEIRYRKSLSDSFTTYKVFAISSDTDTYSVDPANPLIKDNLRNINSIQFQFKMFCFAATPIAIDDINIVYRQYRDISINEDER